MSQLVSTRHIRPSRRPERQGAIAVLFAMLIIPVIACVVFAIDVGYLNLVRAELQRAADAGALAGAAGMNPEINSLESFSFTVADPDAARPVAQLYVKYNEAGPYDGVSSGSTFLLIDLNLANDPAGNIVLGRFNVPSDLSEPFTVTMVGANSVQVCATLAEGHANDPLSMFFAGVLGFPTANVGVTATATVEYATLLPFTTSEEKWNTLATGGDGDNFHYSPGNVTSGGDSVPEIVIFPNFQWDGVDMPPGNFGALRIGLKSGTTVVSYQIDSGPTQADLAYHGGTLSVGMTLPAKRASRRPLKQPSTAARPTAEHIPASSARSALCPCTITSKATVATPGLKSPGSS